MVSKRLPNLHDRNNGKLKLEVCKYNFAWCQFQKYQKKKTLDLMKERCGKGPVKKEYPRYLNWL